MAVEHGSPVRNLSLDRVGALVAAGVDLSPAGTPNAPLKRAPVMWRFTAEDAIKSIQNVWCSPELVPVLANA